MRSGYKAGNYALRFMVILVVQMGIFFAVHYAVTAWICQHGEHSKAGLEWGILLKLAAIAYCLIGFTSAALLSGTRKISHRMITILIAGLIFTMLFAGNVHERPYRTLLLLVAGWSGLIGGGITGSILPGFSGDKKHIV